MHKRKGKQLFWMLMAMQSIVGIIWAALNINQLSRFHDTLLYIKASEQMVIDEYMGILYPLLIALTRGIERIVGVPFCSVLYLIQLAAATAATVRFLLCMNWVKELGKTRPVLLVLGTLYCVTFPLLLQMHMAVLPYSLACSVFLLLMIDGVKILQQDQGISGKNLIRICGWWLMSYLLLPEYGVLSGIIVFIIFIRIIWKDKKSRLRLLVVFLSTILCFGVVAKSTQVQGSMGRMQKTVASTMVKRFVWPYFLTNYFFWDERIKEVYESEEMVGFASYPEAVIYEFGPTIEKTYGKEIANELYWDMAWASLKIDTKRNLLRLVDDFMANLCPQGALLWQLNEKGTLVNGWNYSSMQENALRITKFYVSFSLISWAVMSAVGIVLLLSQKKTWKDIFAAKKVMLLSGIFFIALWYTMTNSLQDYKKVMFGSFLWLLIVIKAFLAERE